MAIGIVGRLGIGKYISFVRHNFLGIVFPIAVSAIIFSDYRRTQIYKAKKLEELKEKEKQTTSEIQND